jgi:hypothetical protein
LRPDGRGLSTGRGLVASAALAARSPSRRSSSRPIIISTSSELACGDEPLADQRPLRRIVIRSAIS